jgi:DNA polymerase-3 subunit epsilon
LLDAELLAEVYLGLTRGQGTFEIALQSGAADRHEMPGDEDWPPSGLIVLPASSEELSAHAILLDTLAKSAGKPPLWRRLAEQAAVAEERTVASLAA